VYAGGGLTLTIRGGVLFARGLDTEHHRFTGEPEPLIEGVGTTNGAGLSVSANGLLVLDQQVFSESARVDVLDRKGQTIRTLDERASAFAVAPDGSRVLLAKTNGLWLTDVNRPAPIRPSGDGRSYLAASWSADGKSVTYTRVGLGGGPGLYRRSVSADDEKQVFASSGDVYARNLVPTSAGVVIALLPKRVGSSFDLMRLGVNGALTPFVQTLDNEGSAAVSADGRWVAYESDAGGQWNVYVKAAAGASPPTRITQTGGRQPRWGKDSRELYYLTPDLRVASVNIDTSREPLHVGETTELFRYPSKIDWHSILRVLYPVFDVTGDGQYFVVRVETDSPKPLVLIQNWRALLKRP
jgi:dipeptidyl aminopeptidase/acylaminoacyl peptidase